ncbi:hypothetical protein GWI33_001198, partial [Rhynchophorus ferrugineus]
RLLSSPVSSLAPGLMWLPLMLDNYSGENLRFLSTLVSLWLQIYKRICHCSANGRAPSRYDSFEKSEWISGENDGNRYRKLRQVEPRL